MVKEAERITAAMQHASSLQAANAIFNGAARFVLHLCFSSVHLNKFIG
jgi:hypothetical protein